ncbi:MAG TPA: c-type cytochrome [Pirellulales bacterium]|nr:c-type cytochrome [Pirellulales bacterium]
MDFPVFHLDGMGNRMLVAIVGVLHVAINHPMAVGAMPLVTFLAWRAHRRNDSDWYELAHRILKVCFIVTTTVGALTGVGIWFAVSLVNPSAIASLIRVFFWAWFTEWLVFVTEVVLILWFYLRWPAWNSPDRPKHLRVGIALSFFSWVTMALIVAILGFMMDHGAWQVGSSLLTAIFNPLYLPQLAFRTTLAMVMAGLFVWMLIAWFEREPAKRSPIIRLLAIWILVWSPLLLAGATWYRSRVPEAMAGNFPVALGTQQAAELYGLLLSLSILSVAIIVGLAGFGAFRPQRLLSWSLSIPFVLSLVLLGQFERVREFIRKPYVVADYMFANGLRERDVPLLQRDGILAHATYCSQREIFPQNKLEAGGDVFRLACSRCHTTQGMNSILAKSTGILGDGKWDPDRLASFIEGMHGARPYMPPFPGNREELDALVSFILDLRGSRARLPGDQTAGVSYPSDVSSRQRYDHWEAALLGESFSTRDRQQSTYKLAQMNLPEADNLLSVWLSKLESASVPRELELDLLLAAKASKTRKLSERAARIETQLDAAPVSDRFRVSLMGGNATRGAALFQSKTCISCHKIDGIGAEVGPDLSRIASKRNRDYLLQAIVAPSAQIAEGFESATIILDDGTSIQGIIKQRDDKVVLLRTAAGKDVSVAVAEIDEEVRGQTLMPLDIYKTLDRSELRDLVEYLASRN